MKTIRTSIFKKNNFNGYYKIALPKKCPVKNDYCFMRHEMNGDNEDCRYLLFDYTNNDGSFVYCDYEETSVSYIKGLKR